MTTKAVSRVRPVHLMNVDWEPDNRQPSDQANRISTWAVSPTVGCCHPHHHRHLLLLLSPKAETHFIVPQRVEG